MTAAAGETRLRPGPEKGPSFTDLAEPRGVQMPAWLPAAVDPTVLVALVLVGVSGMGPVFGGTRYLVVAATAAVLGAAVAWVAAWRNWPLWSVLVGAFAVHVLIAPLVTQPEGVLVAVAPTPSGVGDVLVGSFQGWANLVTTTVPVGSAQKLLLVPWVLALVCTTASVSIARRSPRAYLAALLGPFVVLIASILVGVDEPAWLAQSVVVLVVSLVWGSYRQRNARSAGMPISRRLRLPSMAALLLVAAAVGLVAGQSDLVTGSEPRTVVREQVEPPVDLRDVRSPLEAFRRYRSGPLADEVLFSVEGLRPDERLRLATLDRYDGVVWHVVGDETTATSSSFFQRVGDQIPVDEEGARRRLVVTVERDGGPWVPSLGAVERVSYGGPRASALSEDFRYNLATDTAAEPGGLRTGDRFGLEVVVPEDHADLVEGSPGARRLVPAPAELEIVRQQAREMTADLPADVTPLGRVRHLEARLRGEAAEEERRGYFSDGPEANEAHAPSRPGHGAERMRRLLDPTLGFMIGNEEQYASAMALLADALGFPARVIVGFAPEVGEGPVEVVGSDITAWTEVAVQGVGWVALTPTPTDTDVPTENPDVVPPPERLMRTPPEVESEQPQVESGRASVGDGCEDCGPVAAGFVVPAWVRVAGVAVGPPVLIVLGITALMALLKGRRRARRRSTGSPSARVAAGWDDVCDLACDLGDVVPDRATRREAAVILARPGIATLARTADGLVFGPEPVGPATVDRYWADVATTRAAMLEPASRFARWKALVNPSSLRRSGVRHRADPVEPVTLPDAAPASFAPPAPASTPPSNRPPPPGGGS